MPYNNISIFNILDFVILRIRTICLSQDIFSASIKDAQYLVVSLNLKNHPSLQFSGEEYERISIAPGAPAAHKSRYTNPQYFSFFLPAIICPACIYNLLFLDRCYHLRRILPCAHVCNHGILPPLLFAPNLSHGTRNAVFGRSSGIDGHTKRPSMVGSASSRTS